MFNFSSKSKFTTLFALSAVLASTIASSSGSATASLNKAITPEISSIANKINASSLSKAVPVEDVNNGSAEKLPEDGTGEEIKPIPINLGRKAMTWKLIGSPLTLDGKTYVLYGSDNGQPGGTNPYEGDTSINEYRSLLCINKTGIPAPAGLPSPSVTRGGATKGSWSGGTVLVIPNVQGKQLRSQAVADKMCEKAGLSTRGVSGYRMAEFHDGTGFNPGWSFWAETDGGIDLASSSRVWVRINDQRANPWGL